ncbi:hypothetical protein CsSME_00031493 [Camellia sinensis var. sinensis]|nr:mitochondrial inner membrane protease subunit 1-like [Camellia sinensis]XP_028061839.1 mitochondrial inner membrane protease subunit 1-like [Camellia sinensis]XP_028061840.1 mitochondrial inner membrane protease subunit 1-like [Camellia sinensis]
MGLRKLKELMSIAKEGLDKSFMVAKFFCALHVINAYLCTPALTQGPSMLPTFSLTGDLILAERISTRFGKVVPGDIVLVRSSENPRKIVAKRVKGMEGDSVTYVVDPNNSDRRDTFVVPKGHVWIEGDNIYASNDSRKFGAVPYGLIQSRVFWRVWPPKDFGSVG